MQFYNVYFFKNHHKFLIINYLRFFKTNSQGDSSKLVLGLKQNYRKQKKPFRTLGKAFLKKCIFIVTSNNAFPEIANNDDDSNNNDVNNNVIQHKVFV